MKKNAEIFFSYDVLFGILNGFTVVFNVLHSLKRNEKRANFLLKTLKGLFFSEITKINCSAVSPSVMHRSLWQCISLLETLAATHLFWAEHLKLTVIV